MVEQKGDNELQENSDYLIKGFDYIEFYVKDIVQAAHFFNTTFGLTPTACRNSIIEGAKQNSILLKRENIKFVITSASMANAKVAEHVNVHGSSVKDIAFLVSNAKTMFETAIAKGATAVLEPTVFEDADGKITKATVGAYCDTVHSFIERKDYKGVFFPQFEKLDTPHNVMPTGLINVDHIAICVEAGELDFWCDFYKQIFGFHQGHQENVWTEYSAMNSKVVQNEAMNVRFPIVEPVLRKNKSQVEEFLAYNQGAGVQHIALETNNIIESVRKLKDNGIEFLKAPASYYDLTHDRFNLIQENIDSLSELNILVDNDNWGYLMQIFTKPIYDRPTLFFELIQRSKARGFGSGNIKALYQAVELEQRLRHDP